MTTKKSGRKQTSSSEKRPAKRPAGVSPSGRKKPGEPSAPTTADVGRGSTKSAKAGQPAKERRPSALTAAA